MATSPSLPQPANATVMAVQPITVPITVQMPPPPLLQWWEVQGVLPSIAAVIAVVGTAASLHWNTSRNLKAAKGTTEEQLAHARAEAQKQRENAAEQAQRDRIIAARKALFGELIDDYGKALTLINRLLHLDLNDTDLAHPIRALGTSATKLWIWGEVETVHEVRELYTQVYELYQEALSRCQPIFRDRKLIELIERDASRVEQKHAELSKELDQIELNKAIGWEGVHGRMKSRNELLFDRAADLRSQIFQQWKALSKPSSDYGQFVLDAQTKLTTQVNKVMAAARAELGLEGDFSILEKQSHEINVRTEAAMRKRREALR